jgi:hypothetical protein
MPQRTFKNSSTCVLSKKGIYFGKLFAMEMKSDNENVGHESKCFTIFEWVQTIL